MASQGPLAPTAAVNQPAGTAWTNPTNVFANDGADAVASLPTFGASQNLYPSGFGFSIPTTSQIDGIEVTFEWTFTGPGISEIDIFVTKTGTVNFGTQFVAAAGATSTLGSPTDLWGTTWTPAEINASTFGAGFQAFGSSGGTCTATIDFVTMTVYYSALPTGVVAVSDFSTFPKPPLVIR